MSQDEIIVQIVTDTSGRIIGLSNDGNLFVYENKTWNKF